MPSPAPPSGHAQALVMHEIPRITKLCNRTKERPTLDEIGRIR